MRFMKCWMRSLIQSSTLTYFAFHNTFILFFSFPSSFHLLALLVFVIMYTNTAALVGDTMDAAATSKAR